MAKEKPKALGIDKLCAVGLAHCARPRAEVARLSADEKQELASIVDQTRPPSTQFAAKVKQFWAKRAKRLDELKATEDISDK